MSVAAATRSPGPLSLELGEVAQTWSRSQHRLVVLAAQFADSSEWVLSGSPTAAHWLADTADVAVSTAREWIRIGRRLQQLPATADAFDRGELSYSKVRAVTRVANPDNEAELVDVAQQVPAGEVARAVAGWLQRNLDPDELRAHQQRSRSVRWRHEPDGMVTFTLRLTPWVAGVLITLLHTIVMRRDRLVTERGDDASAGAWPSLAQQRADAIEVLAGQGAGQVDTEIIIHVRGDGCTMDDGTPIADSEVTRQLPCSYIRALISDADSRPINASGRQRHPTTRQKRVVKERDRVCVDCGSSELLEYDHVPDYEDSGQTVVDELEMRCAPCHHQRHRP